MLRVSKRMPWVEFSVALCVLIVVAVASDNVTARLDSDEHRVAHTREVETQIAQLRADLSAASAAPPIFLLADDRSVLEEFARAEAAIPADMASLESLTANNPEQHGHIEDLRRLVAQRLGLLRESITLREKSGSDATQQQEWSEAGHALDQQAFALLDQMRAEEAALLASRQTISATTYRRVRIVLVVSFLAVVILLGINFYDLSKELKERKEAEEAVMQISGRILRLQDSERRRVARELHDSIGQLFSALKMNVDLLERDNILKDPQRHKALLDESRELLDQGLAGARTLSHLLHPPLLDEMGFASAAKWLTDGFSTRSNIQVQLEVSNDLPRMVEDVELTLFRILQESLTNIHKHSGSPQVQVEVRTEGPFVSICVRDFGKGIPEAVLENFQQSKATLGVGLAGMRERVRQLGGTLDLRSNGHGATVEARIPFSAPSSTGTKVSGVQPTGL